MSRIPSSCSTPIPHSLLEKKGTRSYIRHVCTNYYLLTYKKRPIIDRKPFIPGLDPQKLSFFFVIHTSGPALSLFLKTTKHDIVQAINKRTKQNKTKRLSVRPDLSSAIKPCLFNYCTNFTTIKIQREENTMSASIKNGC